MLEKLKSFLATDAYFYSLLLLLVAIGSFGLGKQAHLTTNQAAVSEAIETTVPQPLVPNREVSSPEASGAVVVVGSRSGSRYHLPSCPGAKQIKESNLVTFNTVAAAEAAGYTPAANCDFD